ncbi:cytochrome P450 [Punctularia strigosozonata HHB-11173 SS5]|uniref:cytochrome P450 n=1 Tax=Punctularia strigosozonata (strain HHB-11173) TaxID=741275 RepID=UPI00044169E0|nr:cytochrome P450 [Punctularia strigosozonata HHB-11173 SS5]EIN06323.1 cytochrome P450 [Punctularia strigosozonata HHB-11173 SS5]
MVSLIIAFAVCAACYLTATLLQIGRRDKRLPPGPPTLPVLGNLHLFSPKYTYRQLTGWARTHGDVFSLMLGSDPMVVLSSASAVREVMEKNSAATVSRPPNHFDRTLHDGKYLAMAPYSNDWKTVRRAANSVLTPQAAAKHLPIQRAESLQLLYDVLCTPDRLWWHLRRASNSSIFSVLYGKRVPRLDSPDIDAVFHTIEAKVQLFTPGNFAPVDIFPILKYVPERWASWKSFLRETGRLERAVYTSLLQECKDRVSDGRQTGLESFMDIIVKRQAELGLTDDMATLLGTVLMDGGSDTTPSFMQSFVLMITAHPEVQRRLHEEMDAVVGRERVPCYDDIDNLPYLKATLREVHRFRPVFPMAIPHASIDDVWYGGYIIPRNSTIVVNLWGIYHDPEVFDQPDVFNPDRFLKSEFGVKPGIDDAAFKHSMPFGVGRRICPGRHVADQTLHIQTMDLVWGFDFTSDEAVDIDAYEPYIIMSPIPFKFTIKPRSRMQEELIRNEYREAIPAFEPYEERLSADEKAWITKTRLTVAS